MRKLREITTVALIAALMEFDATSATEIPVRMARSSGFALSLKSL